METASTEIVAISSEWDVYLRPEWIQALDKVPFLARCANGTITRNELHSFVRQQYRYSRQFTRYLCALMANVVNDKDRRNLTDNLFEEMGLGDFGNIPHSQIYLNMMEAMGVNVDAEGVFPTTQKLIDTQLACCQSPHHMVGLGALCLGAEAIVPRMYSTIIKGFAAVGEPEKNLEFFKIHIEGDDEHAVTMRNIIAREIENDPRLRLDLDYGAQKAIDARVEFFLGLDQVSSRN